MPTSACELSRDPELNVYGYILRLIADFVLYGESRE